MKSYFLLLYTIFVAIATNVNAQTKVRGTVTDTRSHGIEYATICVDSAYAISDKDGHFELVLPNGSRADMVVSHISYKPKSVLHDVYKLGNVEIILNDKAYDLEAVDIVRAKTKLKNILGKGMKLPGDAAFGKAQKGNVEMGPLFTPKSDYAAVRFDMKVEECTYSQCVVRLIIYKVSDTVFEPIMAKPLYMELTTANKNSDISIHTTSPIALRKGETYYIGVSVVAGSANGTLHFPAHLRSSYVRDIIKGTHKKIPATLGVSVMGYKMKE